jgi:small-conductance mechanosensitive channel
VDAGPVARLCARLSLALLLGAVAALGTPAAHGQLPGLPAAAKPAAGEAPAAAQPPETDEQLRARLQAQVDQARSVRERLAADPAALGAPPGVPAEELTRARSALNQLVLSLENQLRLLGELQSVRAERREVEKSSRDWKGLGSPPYSLLLVDDLHEGVESIRTTLNALAAQRVIAEREGERARQQAQRNEAELRRAREVAALAGEDERAKRQWQAQLAAWSAESAAVASTLYQRGVELVDEQVALENERLKFAERKLQVASGDFRFSKDDLATIRSREEQRMERIRSARVKAGERAAALDRELAAATAELQKLDAAPPADPEVVPVARARVRALQAAVEAAKFEIETLDSLATAASMAVDLYSLRLQALEDGDADNRRAAVLRLREAAGRFKPWKDYAHSQLELLRAAQRETTVRIDSQDTLPAVRNYENAIAETIRQRMAFAQRLLDAAERGQRTVERWLAEIDTDQQARPLGSRVADAWAVTVDWTRRIWNFELFAVEDTVEVGGQKITTSRGVTIGKSVGALLLFVVGYWLATRAARYFERLLIGRFSMEPAQARTVRRWALALWAFVLLALTLNLARIPLTVFAFLGGALAIGVGFGTQTIIRNFISGLIVPMERQVQVGDIVEVDGVTGTVTEVNLRSSTLMGFDGVEAIIPNASLLENKVTNWTHTDKRVRRVIKVGVAYGSPVRRVAELLLDCMQRHGQVLKDPEPRVLFDDFGDSALVFSMQFWLEMKPGVSSVIIMSDLRFMVYKALDEAGIAIPFPQRDVRLDTARPLQVELLPRDAPPNG